MNPPDFNAAACRVLIVEDNQDCAEMLALMLQFESYDVRVAGDGEQALSMAGQFDPNVVLLDICLPKLDGLETARRLRQEPKNKNMVLIAVTGYGLEGDFERARAAGCDHHLLKPVQPDALKALLAAIRDGGPSTMNPV